MPLGINCVKDVLSPFNAFKNGSEDIFSISSNTNAIASILDNPSSTVDLRMP
jgi:hypothetical protein